MLLLTGLPLFFLELSLGQYSSLGANRLFAKLAPGAKGVGWGMVFISVILCLYYNLIIAWALYYMYAGLTWELPWASCGHDFSSAGCYSMTEDQICMTESSGLETYWNNTCFPVSDICQATGNRNYNETHCLSTDRDLVTRLSTLNRTTSSEDFFTRKVLRLRDDTSWDNLGEIQPHMLYCLAAAWLIVCLSLIKGVQSSGKVVYFTALFPYVVLILLFVRGLTLDGAYEGIMFYITPRWEELMKPRIWADAATQIFYSLGVTMGGLVALASYNKFESNTLRDSFIISFANCGTSVFSGFVVFSIVGFMAKELNLPVDQVIRLERKQRSSL